MRQDPRDKKKQQAKDKKEKPEEKKEKPTNVPEDRPGETDTSQEKYNDPHPL
jgi:hypothetical protein